jgi:hypothetical protein
MWLVAPRVAPTAVALRIVLLMGTTGRSAEASSISGNTPLSLDPIANKL